MMEKKRIFRNTMVKKSLKRMAALVLAASLVLTGVPVQAEETVDPIREARQEYGVGLNSYDITLFPGETFQLVSGDEVSSWTSMSGRVASVDSNGLVTANAAGTTTVKAYAQYGMVSCTVNVVEQTDGYMSTIGKKEYKLTTEQTTIENDRFRIIIDKGVYVSENLEEYVDHLLDAIENATGYSFYPVGTNYDKVSIYLLRMFEAQAYVYRWKEGKVVVPAQEASLDTCRDYTGMIHELLHMISRRNGNVFFGFFGEGYAEIYDQEVIDALWPNNMVNQCLEFAFSLRRTIGTDISVSDIREKVINNTTNGSVGYFFLKFLRETYGDDKIRELNEAELITNMDSGYKILQNLTSDTIDYDFYNWFQNNFPLNIQPMDYPTGTVLSIRLYLPEETFWYGSYYYYYYPATFTVNDNLTFDFTTAMDYCQQVKGIKFSGLAFTLSDNFNDVLDGTITFYDAEGNALGQTALAYQSYYVPGATSFKVQSENVARLSLVVDEVAMKKSAENAGKATQLTPVTEEEPDDSSGTDDSQPSDDQNGDIADGSGANDSQPGDSADNNGTGDTQPDQSVSGEDQPGDVPSEETPAKVKKPVIVSAKKKTKTSMTIKWKDLSAASGYQIQYSTSSKFAASKTKTVNKAAGVTSVTVKKLLKGKKYYVRMRAYRTVDQMKYFTKWSAKKTVKM